MASSENRTSHHSRKNNTWSQIKLLAVIGLIIVILSALALYIFTPFQSATTEPSLRIIPSPVEMVNDPQAPATQEMLQQEQEKINNSKNVQAPAPDDEVITTSDQSTPPLTMEKQSQQGCELIAEEMITFLNQLDQEEYIQSYELNQPSRQYFIALAEKLLNNPPVVSRETDDLYTILKNMAHFFRVIGQKNIFIIKAILDRERDTIEDIAADLFQWVNTQSCTDGQFTLTAPLPQVYEYAGFFLNTMGGRSYLFRRDSRSRLLVNYYAVLIVSRADIEEINTYGIDIAKTIPPLIGEIEATNQLIYKEQYLDTLYNILEKYE